jgi:hypothetical protein
MSLRLHFTLAAALVAAVGFVAACGDDAVFIDEDPPTTGGEGGFDPGPSPTGASVGAYGYGANTAESTTATASVTASTGDAGTGGAGGATGSGGAGGTGGEPPPECDDADKRCDHTFTYDDNGETSVEVRGDFAPGAWDSGVAMESAGGTWSATVPLPWDTEVHYKFFVNGGDYVTDPDNPETEDDGFGGLNSVLAPTTCPDDYTCVE